jgi:hypothetical protein
MTAMDSKSIRLQSARAARLRSPSGRLGRSELVYAGSAIFLAIELALLLFLAAGTHGLIVPLEQPNTTDFASFYAAGSLADAGAPALAYDQAAHYAAEQRATAPGVVYNYFYYPPVFLMLCAAVARLPYFLAFAAFQAATLALYLFAAQRILDRSGRAALLPLLALPPVLWTIGLGQNALLTAGLFGWATLLVDRRPIAAGMLFGALCYKPHFGLLVPVALIAGGHWRAFVAAALSAAALALSSLLLFGWQTWHDYLVAAAASQSVYASGRIAFAGYVTPFGATRLLGASAGWAYAAQAVATGVAAALVAIVWRRALPLPIRAATLAAATLVAVALALFYDLMLAAIAGCWLVRAGGAYRIPEWGKVVLLALVVLALNPRGTAESWHVPVGPVIPLTLLALAAWPALRRQEDASSRVVAERA